ncbi:uncharacterized protein LOC142337751 isoform X2 [Convolutriloba macropyga]
MKDNLAKLQLKLLQQKLQSRQKPRSMSSRPVPNSADVRLRNAMKDREKLLAELKMEKLKGDSMNSSGHNNGLQRPYLSTDEYPPPNGIPGVYPPMPFSSLGNSRHLDGLEGLALDRRYNFNDVALHNSLSPTDRLQQRSRNHYKPAYSFFPPPPPAFAPYGGYPSPYGMSSYGGYAPQQQTSKAAELMEMMMMQNAQMNQTIMQQMMMSNFAARSPHKSPTRQSNSSPEVRYLPSGPGASQNMMGMPAPLESGSPFRLPGLFSGQMPNSSAGSFHHPSAGPGDFPTEAPAFTVEP